MPFQRSLFLRQEKINIFIQGKKPRHFECGEVNHIRKDCPQNWTDNKEEEAKESEKTEETVEKNKQQGAAGQKKRKAEAELPKSQKFSKEARYVVVCTEDSDGMRYVSVHTKNIK